MGILLRDSIRNNFRDEISEGMEMKQMVLVLVCLGCTSQAFGMGPEVRVGEGFRAPRLEDLSGQTRHSRTRGELNRTISNWGNNVPIGEVPPLAGSEHTAPSSRVSVETTAGDSSLLSEQGAASDAVDRDSKIDRHFTAIKKLYEKEGFVAQIKHAFKQGAAKKFKAVVKARIEQLQRAFDQLSKDPLFDKNYSMDQSVQKKVDAITETKKLLMANLTSLNSSFAVRKQIVEYLKTIEDATRDLVRSMATERQLARDVKDAVIQDEEHALRAAEERERVETLFTSFMTALSEGRILLDKDSEATCRDLIVNGYVPVEDKETLRLLLPKFHDARMARDPDYREDYDNRQGYASYGQDW